MVFLPVGAGQVVVMTLVYILHFDTYKSRATSVLMVSIVTIISLVRYMFFQMTTAIYSITIIITALIFGFFGAKIMKKINSPVLNLVSGIIVFVLGVYALIKNILR